MPPRDTRQYLQDILDADALIAEFTAGKSLDDYLSDRLLRSAVERQLGIVGEALSQALKLNPPIAQRIGDTRRIIGFRNRLIHSYAGISNEVVWGIVEAYLPRIRRDVAALLNDLGQQRSNDVPN